MTERYISITDDEYVYFLDTQSEDYKTLEDFEKIEFEEAKKYNVDIEEYEESILEFANDNYWDWVYNYHIEADTVNDLLNSQEEEIQRLKAQLECGEDVCRICKHTYIVPSREYYIAQCKKGHSGCSKGTVDYCDDFELKDSDSE